MDDYPTVDIVCAMCQKKLTVFKHSHFNYMIVVSEKDYLRIVQDVCLKCKAEYFFKKLQCVQRPYKMPVIRPKL